MKTAAWCYDAGLPLAALARLGGEVEKALQERMRGKPALLTFLVQGYSPGQGT